MLRSADLWVNLPAYNRWFLETSKDSSPDHTHDGTKGVGVQLNYDYLSRYGDTLVPLELTGSHPEGEGIQDNYNDTYTNNVQFQRFSAPLSMFLDWTVAAAEQKQQRSSNNAGTNNNVRIYLAQCHLEDLPPQLQSDFHPTPSLVRQTGKGDIYATNLWIGAPPTYTPLHKDPNPNLFVQLAGMKHVRLLPPDAGLQVFASVRQQQQEMMATKRSDGEHGFLGHEATFRGNEMMQGLERVLLERAIWGDLAINSSSSASPSTDAYVHRRIGYDVLLERGDALFIPKGWWHSIKGVGESLTASVRFQYPLFFLGLHISVTSTNGSVFM